GLIWLTSPSGSFVVAPSNDVLGFAPGHAVRRGASVVITETNSVEELRFSSYTYRRMDSIPTLSEGVTTNGTLPADQIQWFSFNAVSGVYYGVTFSNQSVSAQLKIGSSGWSAEDRGWTCSSNGSFLLGLSSTSATPFSLRLYTFTNTIAQMTQWMGEQMTNCGVMGATIAFVNGQDVVWMRGFGEADRAQHIPVAPDTVFRIASISKTFAACSVMQLVERGFVDLDAPLTNYVPQFSIRQRYGANVITVRTVLDQHSGLPCDIGNGYETFLPCTNYIDGLIAGLHDDYAPLPTNTMWHYSNTGFALLTRLIEQASGLSLSSYSQSNLFLPMGMTNASFFHDNPWYAEHLSLGYNSAGEPVGEEYHNAFTAGSIYATAQDMANYIRMILGQGQGAQGHVMDSATVDEMLTSQTAGLPLDVIPMNNWGLGWGVHHPVLDYAGRHCFHDGELTLSFCSFLGILREQGLGVFVSFNTATAGNLIHPAGSHCLQWAAQDKSGLLPPALPQPVFSPVTNLPSAELDAVTGLYVTATGYDFIRRCPTNAYRLDWVVNAQDPAASAIPLVARSNGRFSDPATQTVELVFTNLSGRDVCVKYQYTDLFGHMPSVYAPRFEPVPIPAAWSNRMGEHWVVNLNSQDVVRAVLPMPLNAILWQQDGLLMFYCLGSVSVLHPENDNLAFIAGLGRNQGIAVRIDSSMGEESLWYQNYRCTYAPPQLTAQDSSSQLFQIRIANLRAGATNQIERNTNLLSGSSWDARYQFIPATSGGETNWQEPLTATNSALIYRVIDL
ncbi:MAG: serine hydrolase domain-containing protein, partial [Lentisphaerota bacterium]